MAPTPDPRPTPRGLPPSGPPDMDGASLFGVTPDRIAAIERGWRAESDRVAAAAAEPGFRHVTGDGSRVMRALRDVEHPARRAVGSIAHRLRALADVLHTFTARTIDNDESSAAEFGRLSAHPGDRQSPTVPGTS
ncbi:hypothetical protein GCM10009624_07920 [Gordonia sinesedis]